MLILCFWSCSHSSYYDYSKGAQTDVQRNFESHKQFIKSFSFKGTLEKKIFCERCDKNKYQFLIALEMKKPDTINLGFRSYPPYYSMSKENELNLSVTKGVYEVISVGEIIMKGGDSDDLRLGDQNYKLLSQKKRLWLPELGNESQVVHH